MSLFKKPSELEVKPGIVAMVYGSPGSGKSTLACSAPNAVMIDTDGGVMRINGAHRSRPFRSKDGRRSRRQLRKSSILRESIQ